MLIRHYLHIDPYKLNDYEWSKAASDVAWLLEFLNRQMATAVAVAFGGDKKGKTRKRGK